MAAAERPGARLFRCLAAGARKTPARDPLNWDPPHWASTRVWDFGVGIFVSVATNLATSGQYSVAKLMATIASLLFAASMFWTASTLDEAQRHWEKASKGQAFRSYILNSDHTPALCRWWLCCILCLMLLIGSIVWMRVKVGEVRASVESSGEVW